ncbi:cysteine desulfurase family protein [Enemella sp. A6]|uniref:cysteine desulfurase family protein n=1 Tax=Enemella sp. A6 TaxID=3440152 RepID=UPI003EBBCF30
MILPSDDKPRSYLDHAATSPLRPAALAAMVEVAAVVGNPSSQHASGRAARRLVEDSREQIAELIGAEPIEVIFTSGGTEANNLAVHGSWLARRAQQRPAVMLGTTEHPAVRDQATVIEAEGGRVDWVEVDPTGHSVLPEVAEDTAVLSVMWVNNETGAIQPIPELARAAHASGALFHTDAVQAMSWLPVDFHGSGIDLLSMSAHKIGGPVGIGALVATRAASPSPVLVGGGQERGIRSGTLAPMLMAGFAAALAEAAAEREAAAARLASFGDLIRQGVSTIDGTRVNSVEPVSPAIVNVTFDGCLADDLLLLLDAEGIDCSVGSACAAGVSRASYVLLAMGRDEAAARGSLRFSLGHTTTEADIDRLLAALPGAVARARAASGG